MCESILRNFPVDNNEAILRNSQYLSVEPPSQSQSGAEMFRALTSGEIKLAQTVFQNIINYDRVKIYCHSSQSRIQPRVITTTKNGKVLLSVNEYRPDFSGDYTSHHDSVKYPHLFIFAMSFVWQYFRYDSSFRDPYTSSVWYSYKLDEPAFNFYTMEQQASIIADYWLLNKYDLTEYEELSNHQEYDRIGIDIKENLLMNYASVIRMHIQYME
ncbi:hypothetical protein [Citrobacter freundii]|uniref:hypothetical protein n=2 Tax=Citrobacter freundii TaxID=546 RepID=UPI00200D1986|nr:hypothetical protein [Citrobacter freundii]UQI37385.1 hypothetical protein M3L74_06220 [Citrobacter freundii]